MKWIKLFEEYLQEQGLSAENRIFIGFLIESFLKDYKRKDSKNRIDIIKSETNDIVTSVHLKKLEYSEAEENRYRFINVEPLIASSGILEAEDFDNFLHGNLDNHHYSMIWSYKLDLELSYSQTVTTRNNVFVKWLLLQKLVEKFLPEYQTDILQMKKNIYPINFCEM